MLFKKYYAEIFSFLETVFDYLPLNFILLSLCLLIQLSLHFIGLFSLDSLASLATFYYSILKVP